MLLEILQEVKDKHSLNAPRSIFVTLGGMVILLIRVPANASEHMVCKFVGMLMDVRLEQYLNANLLMV